MLLYVSVDTKNWAKAQFPQSSSARLRENGYTIVESTTHSLAVDVLMQDSSAVGTLFVSNSNGTFFVESLKDTNRNEMGFVDYENLYGVEGVGIANVVGNAQDVEGRAAEKQLKTVMTFDDGAFLFPFIYNILLLRDIFDHYCRKLLGTRPRPFRGQRRTPYRLQPRRHRRMRSPPPFRHTPPQLWPGLLVARSWVRHGRRVGWQIFIAVRGVRYVPQHGRWCVVEDGPYGRA